MELTVYGAEAACTSCIQAPSSRATAEWLEAAVTRKYGNKVTVRYVDLENPETERDRLYCDKVSADEYFYPLVVSGDTVLGDGFISLKPVFHFLDEHGFEDVSERQV
ncbi:DUF1462 family protein [Sporolactobacillus putidus]|uniref:Disulfide oxidoreductase YuzD n=1 Tax=Sporolactobacillus putidus TaxID=492735 RepID=A0A917W1Z4_9BACL|nr:DUF1462 family protein [Sporolactobacillus putidus]GGL53162.1 putative disulfide oxidoreductase YuzD [Sporolactobacillus putidus]